MYVNMFTDFIDYFLENFNKSLALAMFQYPCAIHSIINDVYSDAEMTLKICGFHVTFSNSLVMY